ncbi:hypothetical protein LWI29_004823 [Acer saccharum]|uniref:FAD-binding domain-containing protein n=1 Tax=Acer saccharum TaxID=4024 RepID=A0AA39RGC0_ACESA|nr:hypothetical protein LWI29_004823 [Acer saccharum]
MDQATETKNQVVDDDGGLKRTASRGSFQEPDAVYPAPPPTPADHGADISADLEAQPQPVGPPAIPVDLEAKHEQKAAVDYDQENLDWAVKMIGICLPPPVVIAVQYSLKTDQSHELPLAFHFLSLAIILFFNSLFLSKYLAPEFPKIAKRLGRIASRGSFQEPDTVYPAPPLVPVDHGADLEAQPQLVSAIQKAAADYDQEKLDWAVKMIGFCLPPAVVIAVQFLKTDQSHELPLTFHFLSLALILSFNSLFLRKSIAPKFPKIAKLFERVGIKCSVLEKNKAFSRHTQARFINNRSLEVFRKLDGLAEEIERSQPPVELWRKFIYCTSLTGSILGSVDQMQPQDLEKVVSPVSVAHFS